MLFSGAPRSLKGFKAATITASDMRLSAVRTGPPIESTARFAPRTIIRILYDEEVTDPYNAVPPYTARHPINPSASLAFWSVSSLFMRRSSTTSRALYIISYVCIGAGLLSTFLASPPDSVSSPSPSPSKLWS